MFPIGDDNTRRRVTPVVTVDASLLKSLDSVQFL